MYTAYNVLFIILFQVSDASSQVVYFSRTPQTVVNDEFKMCFGADQRECTDISRPQYEYYIRSNAALMKDDLIPPAQEDHTGLRRTIDSLMYELLSEENIEDLKCIPYISTYTDCTRENICTGCQSCVCDETANWNCTTTMRCTPEPQINIDAQVLQAAVDALTTDNEIYNERIKRELNSRRIDYAYVLKWLYDDDNWLERASHSKNTFGKYKTNDEYEPLVFNEIQSSIYNEETIANSKALKKSYQGNGDKSTNNRDFNYALNMLEKTGATNSGIRPSNVIIDLLESSNINNEDELTDPKLVKRDAPVTEIPDVQVSNSIKKLKEDILYPLTSVIDGKQKEIDELLKIRKKLIHFLMTNKDWDPENINHKIETTESPYVSIYKIEVLPEGPDGTSEFRRTNNTALVENYFMKLKRDIYEVIKDIVGIQKYSNTKTLPQDLKVLIRAMRYYVRHQDELLFSGNKINSKNIPTQNKNQSLRERKHDYTNIKETLTKIFRAIQETSIPDAIDVLSPKTYKIVKQIIKEKCNDIYGSHFNLTIDIKDVGSLWNPIMKDAEGASPLDKLSYMKLLYIVLIADMNKVNNAIHIMDFAKNRRMSVNGNMMPMLAKRINFALSKISEKLNEVIQQNANPTDSPNHYYKPSPLNPHLPNLIKIHGYSEKSPMKKESMLRHIKDMLKTSKHEIVNLMRRNVPKSEIIKTIAKKKLGMMSKEQHIQEVMENWQRNLNVSSSRSKRFAKKKRLAGKKRQKKKIKRSKKSGHKKAKSSNSISNKIKGFFRGKRSTNKKKQARKKPQKKKIKRSKKGRRKKTKPKKKNTKSKKVKTVQKRKFGNDTKLFITEKPHTHNGINMHNQSVVPLLGVPLTGALLAAPLIAKKALSNHTTKTTTKVTMTHEITTKHGISTTTLKTTTTVKPVTETDSLEDYLEIPMSKENNTISHISESTSNEFTFFLK